MTDPGPESQGSQGSGQGSARRAPAPAKIEPLAVGHFRHRDHLLGSDHDRFGVVVSVGDVLAVYPLERYTLQVDPAEFHVITADDLDPTDEDAER